MGLFCEKSSWIWLDKEMICNRYMELEARFRAKGPVTLHVSVEGQFAAFVNGTRVNSTQYPDYPKAKAVQCADVTALCGEGENTLTIQTWYPGEDTSVTRLEAPGMRYELWQGEELLCCSDANSMVRPMTQYEMGPVQRFTGQLGYAYNTVAAEEAPWQNAVCVDKPAQLVPRPIRELQIEDSAPAQLISQGTFHIVGGKNVGERMQTAGMYWQDCRTMTSQKTTLPSEEGVVFRAEANDGIYLVYDLNELYEGYLELDVTCPQTAKIDVGYGEHLEDLRARTSVGGRCFALTLTVGPERRYFCNWFRRLGGRYLQLFIHSHEATVYTVGLKGAYYPVDERAEIRPMDYLHDRIAKISRRTLQLCMHEHYEDCPWREQALYASDSRNQMLAGYYAFGEFTFARENLRTMALSQREDGMLELCSPARVPITIPGFSMQFVVAVEEYCRYSGDLEFGREMIPVAERILDALAANSHDGLAWRFTAPQYWNFYEWQPLLDGGKIGRRPDEVLPESAEAGLQLFGILALQRMRALREMLGMPVCEKETALEKALTDGLEQYWSEEDQAYASYIEDGKRIQYAELIQSLAVYAGIVPADRAAILREKLYRGGLITVTLSYSLFKYEALLQDPAYTQLVVDEIAERWSAMLYRGATTFWEVEDGAEAFDRAGSLCHGWSSIPLYLYGHYILGVRPVAPGDWQPVSVPSTRLGISATLATPRGHFEAETCSCGVSKMEKA